MKIGIDARFYGPEGTGIGRYVEKLLENLEEIDETNEYFVFLRKSNYFLYNPKKANFHKIKADARWYSVKEQVIMPAVLLRQKLDLVHFPHFNIPLLYPGKFVVTIHDLTLNQNNVKGSTRSLPVYLTKQKLYNLTISQAIKRANRIIVPSKFVKQELTEKMKINKDKVVVTYESAEDFAGDFKLSEGRQKEIFSKYSIRSPYLIYLGTSYPHKNLERLFEAFGQLNPKLNLVLVSRFDKFSERVREKGNELGLGKRLIATGTIPDADLKVLLKKALCLVQPSLSEGFGLPGLEAMSLGCPVIASKSSSLPEIYGKAAEYFDPLNTKDMARRIEKFINSKELLKEKTKLGFSQAKQYSWKKMAEQTLKVYTSYKL